jgi:Fe-S-cluster containining protein
MFFGTTEQALAELRGLYASLERDLAEWRRPCQACGRCCHFHKAEHTLFLTGLEAAELAGNGSVLAQESPRGACPFLNEEGRCGARERRGLGCRIFFCDAFGEEARCELYERCLRQIRDIEKKYGVPPMYAPLHRFFFVAGKSEVG